MARPHGLRGEVVVELVTNRHERLAAGADLQAAGATLRVETSRPLHGTNAPPGQHGDRWVVQFAGIAGREGAETLRGVVLLAPPLDGDEDTMWVHDLIGAEVIDQAGQVLGTVAAVEANPASDLLVLDGGALVPLVFVVERAPGRLTVDVPAGLFDL